MNAITFGQRTGNLIERFENGKRIGHAWVGEDHQAVSRAQREASQLGLRNVCVYGQTYVSFGGVWYGWSIPDAYACPR